MLTPGDEPNILIATTTSNVILLFATPHGIPFQPLSVSPSVSDPISSKPHENIPSSITVGGIELPVFIVLCVFGPFALSLVVFTLWKYTVVNLRHRKPPRAQATMEEGREEAEMQSRDPMRQNAKGTATIYLPPKLPAETHSAREVKSESEMVNFSWPVLSTLYHKPV
jgi:hypothetical protein